MSRKINTINKYGKATKALHKYYGFDFQKSYRLIRFYGNFTINQIRKAASEVGYTTANALILILARDNSTYTWKRDRYILAKLTAAGYEWDIYHGYGSGLDTEITKGSFEEMRKRPTTDGYILMQKKTDLCPVKVSRYTWEKNHQPTTKDRYKFVEFWHSQTVKLMRTDNNGEVFEYYVLGGINADNIREYLDKSGYLVKETREELKRRVDAYKRDNAKKAYLAQDYTERIKALRALADAKKRLVADRLMNARTADDIDHIRDMLGWSRLYSAYRDIESMEKSDREKDYSSCESFERDYNGIIDTLAHVGI